LPNPPLGENASAVDYLRAAHRALAAHHTRQAQQAVDMAQTGLLDPSVPLFQTNAPSTDPVVWRISEALQALAACDRGQCMQSIEAA